MTRSILLMPAVLAALIAPAGRADEVRRTGEVIYRELCTGCHGPNGEGVADKYDEPLYGERSLESLTRLIDRTMPEDEPEKCDAVDSAAVAEYIFNAFYSPQARARNNPVRVDLVRLTNRQYRESVADLVGSFLPRHEPGEPTGLIGEYHQSKGMNKKQQQLFGRRDQALDFDFGEGSPGAGINPEQFSIAWNGSLIADETGTYEFRLRTPNGARLYLNSDLRDGDRNFRDDSDARRQAALIDAWVSSGGPVREETARVFLLGGRRYPLRLDYFKFKDKTASIRLEWKPPHRAWAVLSTPYLSPAKASRVTVTSTAFPPDDGSLGYERGTGISKGWHEATTRAAIETAGDIEDRLNRLSGVADDAQDRVDRLKEFAHKLAERAFRRPLTAEQRTFYVDRHFTGTVPPPIAVKRSALLVLKSPRFLYPDVGGESDDYAVASRLALSLWDSLPDEALTEAARRGELRTRDQLRTHARRMMEDPRSKAKLREFFHHWLAFEEAEDIAKDTKDFPGFDEALVADLRTSLETFVEDIVWSESSDYRQLLLADYVFLNPRLARFYGVEAPPEESFQRVVFDPSQRAGIFTHPYLLTTFSYHRSSSPIHRGVFLTRNILGRFLKPPPMAIEFMDDKFDPSLTMREKVTELTSKASCMTCHATINPLGFSLENFDAVGRFRTTENNKPVIAESEYTTTEGDTVQLRGPRDLAQHAAASPDARLGFVRQLFHFAIKQSPVAYGPDTLQRLDTRFRDSYHIRDLMVDIATLASEKGPKPLEPSNR